MKALLEANKYETRLLGKIQRYMMAREHPFRDMTKLHPSEMAKSDWCPRASYYRISGVEPDAAKDREYSFVLDNIFTEGHEVHGKWQDRIRAMGKLRGKWKCMYCGHVWEGISPLDCQNVGCVAGPECIEYREVSLFDERHGIIGHADGDIVEGGDVEDDPLLEVKTIGIGTLRFEAPSLLDHHTHKLTLPDGTPRTFVDYDRLWNDIKRPFPSHLRQANLYLFLKGRKHMVFIYECKWNQQVKEFVIRYRPEVIADLLDQALDVQYALKKQTPPDRPHWAAPDAPSCKACPFEKECYGEPGLEADSSSRGSSQGSGDAGPQPARAAEVRDAQAAPAPVRLVRRRTDAAVRGDDEVD